MKRLLTLAFVFILVSQCSWAQTWQWGKRGGASYDPGTGVNMYNREDVYDIATDRNGNVYTLSMVTGGGVTVGTSNVTTYGGSFSSANLLITSHSCNGTLRWAKAIGGENGNSAIAIRTDTFGHVYVMGGAFGQYPISISGDTTITTLYRRVFIVQYDTSGNFKWVTLPDADTLTTFSKTQGYDMEVDGAGNLNAIIWLNKGSLNWTSYSVNAPALYVLKYNAQGSLLAATRPPGFDFAVTTMGGGYAGYPNVGFNSFRMARMSNGNWIIAGQQYSPVFTGFSINGGSVPHELFIACFNSTWQHQWHYNSDTTTNGIFGRPAIDNSNAIYLTGYAFYHTNLFGIPILTTPLGELPYVAKLNSSGAAQWLTFPSNNRAVDGCSASARGKGIALTSSGDVVITGGCGGLQWGTMHIPGKCNTGYTAYVGRFNTTLGTCLALDTLAKQGGGGGNFGSAIAASKNNCVYVGGTTEGNQIAGADTMIFAGGTSDFFVARFGYPCNCTTSPISNFNSSLSGKAAQVTYSGSTSAIDSVVWIWGDGQKQNVIASYTTPLTHTYTTAGTYNVCANVYGSCGSASYCKSITITVAGAVNTLAALGNIMVYPNPTANFFTVEGAQGAAATLTNSIGQVTMRFTVNTSRQVMDISSLPSGSYILQLTDAKGNRGATSIMKQ